MEVSHTERGMMKATLLLAAVCGCLCTATANAQQGGQPAADRLLDSLLAQMTLEEKVGQLAQYTGQWVQDHPEVTAEHLALVRQGRVGSFLNVYGAAYTREVQQIAVRQSRLGIPLLMLLATIFAGNHIAARLAFDHHPQHRLGAGGPQQHPSFSVEGTLRRFLSFLY